MGSRKSGASIGSTQPDNQAFFTKQCVWKSGKCVKKQLFLLPDDGTMPEHAAINITIRYLSTVSPKRSWGQTQLTSGSKQDSLDSPTYRLRLTQRQTQFQNPICMFMDCERNPQYPHRNKHSMHVYRLHLESGFSSCALAAFTLCFYLPIFWMNTEQWCEHHHLILAGRHLSNGKDLMFCLWVTDIQHRGRTRLILFQHTWGPIPHLQWEIRSQLAFYILSWHL